MIITYKFAAAMGMLIVLTACGGGGGETGGGTNAQTLTVSGDVTDASSNVVISGAVVDIPLQTTTPTGNTDTDGHYSLKLPNSGLPKFIGGTVNMANYMPGIVLFEYGNGQLTPLTIGANNAALVPIRPGKDVVFLNGLSIVHLGDGDFSGAENSQLQVQASGLLWRDRFTLTAVQKTNYTTFTVTLYARGIQSEAPKFYCDLIGLGNNVDLNGALTGITPQTLMATAADGSFTKITHTFSLSDLAADADAHLQILSGKTCSSSGADHDDFEIVAVTGELN